MSPETRTRVEDVMSTPLETISKKATVQDAAEHLSEQNINALFVPGSQAGIITNSDVVTVVADGRDPTEVTVADVMTSPVERVATNLELGEAAAMMTTYGIKHLPVIDDHGDYVGMVSSTDVTDDAA
ncbi:CBS domain-containing protein [Halapricum salinum]|uniref:CBS domain-containing protein n=1 Tax=Halapricum salinum TaxID=1457250 RepID=A0A4D6HDF0_9EURY|nr:CBS domain-containing protein [Halapricum salinum]QCC51591.1 CBS domain-containing protein [Halapricum salinum]